MPKRKANRYSSVAAFAAAHGLKNYELADLLNVDPSLASKLRSGKRYPSLVLPLKIARVCRVPIEALAPDSAA